MGIFHCTLQFGMVLYANKERMVLQFNDLNQTIHRIFTTGVQTGLYEIVDNYLLNSQRCLCLSLISAD